MVIDKELIQVMRREVHLEAGERKVIYSCWTQSGGGKLIVTFEVTSPGLRVVWQEKGPPVQLLQSEVEVYTLGNVKT